MRTERVPEIFRSVSVGAVFENPSGRLVYVKSISSFGRVHTTCSDGPRFFDSVEEFAYWLVLAGFKFLGHEQQEKA